MFAKRTMVVVSLTGSLLLGSMVAASAVGASQKSKVTASEGVTIAKKAVIQDQKLPTQAIPPGIARLKAAPTKGKLVIFMQAEQEVFAQLNASLNAGATAAGWNYKSIPFLATNSATLVAGMQQALTYHPTAVLLFGIPYADWSSLVPAYKTAHVAIVTADDPGVPVTPITSGQILPNFYGQANPIANYVVAKSNGKAHVLMVDAPAYPVELAATKRFQSDLASICPGCTTTTLNVSIAQVDAGQTEPLIVSALQKDTNVDYVEICNGQFVPGFPSALAAAGLSSRVKVVGFTATTQDSAAIKAGTEQAYTPLADSIQTWLMIDAALRFAEGMTIPTSAYATFGTPTVLIDSATVNSISEANVSDFQIPTNWRQQFLKLWKVS